MKNKSKTRRSAVASIGWVTFLAGFSAVMSFAAWAAEDITVAAGETRYETARDIGAVTVAKDGVLILDGYDTFQFNITRGRDGELVGLGEIVLTYDGVPIPRDAYGECTVNSQYSSDHKASNLVDNSPSTGWTCKSGDTGAIVTVKLSRVVPVNGYQLVATQVLGRAPTDWTVSASVANGAAATVDSRESAVVGGPSSWTSFGQNQGTNFLFNQVQVPLSVSAKSLAGAGVVRIGSGLRLVPGDITGWTGSFETTGTQDFTERSAIVLPKGESSVAVANPSAANIALMTASADGSVVVLNGSADDERLFGSLADGDGPVGLIKRGDGQSTVEMMNSKATGDILVESGRLRVVGPVRAITTKVIRIIPIENGHQDSNGYNWSMNDFQLLDASGNRVPFPEGTAPVGENGFHNSYPGTNLIDGDTTTRCLVKNKSDGSSSVVTITMPSEVTFYGYRWYTANAGSEDRDWRVLRKWRVETGDDSRIVSQVVISNYKPSTGSVLMGPYAIEDDRQGADAVRSLPRSFFAGDVAMETSAAALSARYFRFAPFDTQNRNGEYWFGWQASEISIYHKGARLDWESGATVKLIGCQTQDSDQTTVNRLIDNGTASGRFMAKSLPSYVDIDAGGQVLFDAYGFFSCPDNQQRSPSGWKLFVSNDKVNWYCVDTQSGVPQPKAGNQEQGPWSLAGKIPLLANGGGDAIGDGAKVSIAQGATLEMDSEYERVGALSGAGTFQMLANAKLDLSTSADVPFSGTISGGGIVRVLDGGVLNVNGANLSGVRSIELKGGRFTGSASCSGADLSLVFDGGAIWGAISGVGTLTVSGTPKIALPNDIKATRGAEVVLVSAASIPQDVQAAFESCEVIRPEGVSWPVEVTATSTEIKAKCYPRGIIIVVR